MISGLFRRTYRVAAFLLSNTVRTLGRLAAVCCSAPSPSSRRVSGLGTAASANPNFLACERHASSRAECGCHVLMYKVRKWWWDLPAEAQRAVTADAFRVMVSPQNRDQLEIFSIQSVPMTRFPISKFTTVAHVASHRSDAIATKCADQSDFKGAHASFKRNVVWLDPAHAEPASCWRSSA